MILTKKQHTAIADSIADLATKLELGLARVHCMTEDFFEAISNETDEYTERLDVILRRAGVAGVFTEVSTTVPLVGRNYNIKLIEEPSPDLRARLHTALARSPLLQMQHAAATQRYNESVLMINEAVPIIKELVAVGTNNLLELTVAREVFIDPAADSALLYVPDNGRLICLDYSLKGRGIQNVENTELTAYKTMPRRTEVKLMRRGAEDGKSVYLVKSPSVLVMPIVAAEHVGDEIYDAYGKSYYEVDLCEREDLLSLDLTARLIETQHALTLFSQGKLGEALYLPAPDKELTDLFDLPFDVGAVENIAYDLALTNIDRNNRGQA